MLRFSPAFLSYNPPMSDSKPRVAVIGLDCYDPTLCFERWIDRLPCLRGLMERGRYGTLVSSMPPVTVPAWSCMTSGKDPGTLGIYGFRDRKSRNYGDWTISTSLRVKEPRLWDILTQSGRESIILSVPGTYPITRPIKGCLVTSFLTPSTTDPKIQYTSPPSLAREIERLVGEYMVDVRMTRGADKKEVLEQIYEMTRRRFKVAGYLIKSCPWDLFFMVEMGPDRIHHAFWSFMDPDHRNHRPGHPLEHAIRDYYVYLDGEIARLIELFDLANTHLWLVSDHGARLLKGSILINQWLYEQCDLAFKTPPMGRVNFDESLVDWPRTRAFAAPGYYGQIFINVRGRDPEGSVAPEEYDACRDGLIARLEAMTGPDGRPLGNKCYKPDKIYKRCNNVPPDLIIIFGDLAWRCSGWVGGEDFFANAPRPQLFHYDDEAAAEDANHAQNGMYLITGPGVRAEGRQDGMSIYDVAPTILAQLGLASSRPA